MPEQLPWLLCGAPAPPVPGLRPQAPLGSKKQDQLLCRDIQAAQKSQDEVRMEKPKPSPVGAAAGSRGVPEHHGWS